MEERRFGLLGRLLKAESDVDFRSFYLTNQKINIQH